MKNSDVAHKFFYQEQISHSFNYRSMTVSFELDTYRSYNTAIGKIIKGKNGQDVLLLSDDNFSNTTSKHIGELMRACPFGWNNIIRIPQHYGHYFIELTGVQSNFILLTERLKDSSKQKMSQKANRERFSHYYEILLKINDLVCDVDIEIINQYKDLYEQINDPEKLAILKAKNKQKEAEKQSKLKTELAEILKTHTISSLAWLAYGSAAEPEIKTKIKQYLNPKNDLSFIWFDIGCVKTSQHISVNRKEVETLLKLWEKGKLKHGMKIGYYTVMSITNRFVKVGCHLIPTENLQDLCNFMSETAVA